MGKSSTIRLTNGVVFTDFVVGKNVKPLFADVVDFLHPIFYPFQSKDSPDMTVRLENYDSKIFATFPEFKEEICIRRGTGNTRCFNLTLKLAHRNVELFAHDEENQTAFRVDKSRNNIWIYCSQKSFVHLIEFIRSTTLVAEDRLGTVVLHASSVLTSDGATVILGHKGAGKTTTQWGLLSRRNCHYISGDKVLLSSKSGVSIIRGWPDYPHVGFGTLREYPEIARRCGIDLDNPAVFREADNNKILISWVDFRKAFGCPLARESSRINKIIFVEFSAHETNCRLIPQHQKNIQTLSKFIEKPSMMGPGVWHGLFKASHISDKLTIANNEIHNSILAAQWWHVSGRLYPNELIFEDDKHIY